MGSLVQIQYRAPFFSTSYEDLEPVVCWPLFIGQGGGDVLLVPERLKVGDLHESPSFFIKTRGGACQPICSIVGPVRWWTVDVAEDNILFRPLPPSSALFRPLPPSSARLTIGPGLEGGQQPSRRHAWVECSPRSAMDGYRQAGRLQTRRRFLQGRPSPGLKWRC